jgi:mannose-6-phosphate isomerase-like protein (cupin superfamily)
MEPVKLAQKLASFDGHWQPRVVGQFNGHDLMVAKALGEFVWHRHDDTDDFFLVLSGRLVIEMQERSVALGPGEQSVVPRGVEHRPVARAEVQMLLVERSGTPNTGDAATAAPRRVI